MTVLIIVAAAIGGILLLVGLMWVFGWAIDRIIKDYIDYAKKEKGDGGT